MIYISLHYMTRARDPRHATRSHASRSYFLYLESTTDVLDINVLNMLLYVFYNFTMYYLYVISSTTRPPSDINIFTQAAFVVQY